MSAYIIYNERPLLQCCNIAFQSKISIRVTRRHFSKNQQLPGGFMIGSVMQLVFVLLCETHEGEIAMNFDFEIGYACSFL